MKILQELCEWLQLQPHTFNTEHSYNSAALPANAFTRWMNRNKDIKRKFSQALPESWRHALRRWAYTKKNLPVLTAQDYETAMPLFLEDVKNTERITGISLSHWYK
jgi:hypothetical protein